MACEVSGSEVSEMAWECNRVFNMDTPLSRVLLLMKGLILILLLSDKAREIATVVNKTIAAVGVPYKLCDR